MVFRTEKPVREMQKDAEKRKVHFAKKIYDTIQQKNRVCFKHDLNM